MNKTKFEKGITLIALIITIVVLLVLAIVTMGAVQESKIIGHSQKAASEYKIAQEKEQIGIGYSEYIIEKNTTSNAQLEVKGAQVTPIENAGWEVVFSETNSKYQVDKSGTITYIEEGEDGGQGDGNGENDDSTEEIMWVYETYQYGNEEPEYYLYFIGNVTELELTEDKEIKAYVGVDNDGNIEYDENQIVTVKLSEVTETYGKTYVEKLTVGEAAKNVFFETKELVVLGDMTEIPEYYFNESGIENLVIHDGVENIGEYAFARNNLKRLTLPASVKTIGKSTFDFDSTGKIYYGGTQEQWNAISSAFPSGRNIKVIFNDGTEIII